MIFLGWAVDFFFLNQFLVLQSREIKISNAFLLNIRTILVQAAHNNLFSLVTQVLAPCCHLSTSQFSKSYLKCASSISHDRPRVSGFQTFEVCSQVYRSEPALTSAEPKLTQKPFSCLWHIYQKWPETVCKFCQHRLLCSPESTVYLGSSA